MKATLRRQRGVTLLVGLVMLVLMTLIAVSVFNLGKGNLQVVANMQYRNDSLNAAQDAVEEVISKTDFTVFPPIPLFGNGNTKGYDVNGDGTADVTVSIGSSKDPTKPTCISAQVVQNANLNIGNPADVGCIAAIAMEQGVTGPVLICSNIAQQLLANPTDPVLNQQSTDLGCKALITGTPGASLCADTLWEIQATATDNVTQAKAVTTAGVKVRVASNNIAQSCP